MVLLHASRVTQDLRKIETSPPDLLLFLAKHFYHIRACRVPPDGVGRNDRIGRLIEDGVAQRQGDAAFRGFDIVRPNIFQALVVAAKPKAPPGLDRAGRGVLNHVDDRLPFTLGNLAERRFHGRSGSRVPVLIERHVR